MLALSIAPFLASALLMPLQPPLPAPPASAIQTPSAPLPPLTLAGCVENDVASPTQYTLFDPHRGVMYRVSGPRLRYYAGRRVQVVGALVPTTNIAAQAGSIDETTAANAWMSTNVAGSTPLNRPKVHVEKIRLVPGGCPAK